MLLNEKNENINKSTIYTKKSCSKYENHNNKIIKDNADLNRTNNFLNKKPNIPFNLDEKRFQWQTSPEKIEFVKQTSVQPKKKSIYIKTNPLNPRSLKPEETSGKKCDFHRKSTSSITSIKDKKQLSTPKHVPLKKYKAKDKKPGIKDLLNKTPENVPIYGKKKIKPQLKDEGYKPSIRLNEKKSFQPSSLLGSSMVSIADEKPFNKTSLKNLNSLQLEEKPKKLKKKLKKYDSSIQLGTSNKFFKKNNDNVDYTDFGNKQENQTDISLYDKNSSHGFKSSFVKERPTKQKSKDFDHPSEIKKNLYKSSMFEKKDPKLNKKSLEDKPKLTKKLSAEVLNFRYKSQVFI